MYFCAATICVVSQCPNRRQAFFCFFLGFPPGLTMLFLFGCCAVVRECSCSRTASSMPNLPSLFFVGIVFPVFVVVIIIFFIFNLTPICWCGGWNSVGPTPPANVRLEPASVNEISPRPLQGLPLRKRSGSVVQRKCYDNFAPGQDERECLQRRNIDTPRTWHRDGSRDLYHAVLPIRGRQLHSMCCHGAALWIVLHWWNILHIVDVAKLLLMDRWQPHAVDRLGPLTTYTTLLNPIVMAAIAPSGVLPVARMKQSDRQGAEAVHAKDDARLSK